VDRQLSELSNITSELREDLLETAYILGDILNNVTSENCNPEIVQVKFSHFKNKNKVSLQYFENSIHYLIIALCC